MMASSSSSDVPEIKHDVFISFRGSDTKRGFLSHLRRELSQKKIDAYVDERLERGDEISSALFKAIEGSKISLIIFSQGYASSKWCLEELVKIIQCKQLNDQIVIPVFYNIDPSYVRHQKCTYREAFALHEQKFKENIEKVQIWRYALNKAANLSGYDLSNFENESELIDELVQDVLEKLEYIYPIEPNGLVGMDQNFTCIESLLKIESKDVLVVGIWGMGGIGKTTLARAVCDKYFSKYESCCFPEDVREESKKNGLSYLHKKLLSELLGEENLHRNDTMKARPTMVIRRRLCRKKVLIVLDDVDSPEQLDYLVGEQPYLGPGSRVIITSRDKHIFISRGIDAIHEVKELNFEESLKLFSLNAFNQSHPKRGYEELSKRAVVYANGIPLALKVLGSDFRSRSIETWESTLKKLKKYPNVRVQNVLKVSYDGLDCVEKDIFLDIAFFFKGEFKDDVIRFLDSFGFYGASGIDSLLDKALITLSTDNKIQMHDLIQEMGEQVVREESIKDPGKRSRLNDGEEVYDVLQNNKGTDAVEGIILDVSQIKHVQLNADSFKAMTNLRFLKFYYGSYIISNVKLPTGLESFSNKLSFLQWDGYPLESLPSTFYAEKLVELHLRNSNVKKLWDGVQDVVNLKRIDLWGCKKLMELPDLSKAQHLKMVDLSYCKSLCNVHPSILSLESLVFLSLVMCTRLKSLESETHLKSLRNLRVDGCSVLKEFSLSSEEITRLDLTNTGIQILHSSIGRLSKISRLSLNGSRLKNLPMNELCRLKSLEDLRLYNCREVIDKSKLQMLFDSLCFLQYLYLDGCSLSELPENISALSLLVYLELNGSSIESLPASIKLLSNLEAIHLEDCTSLRSLPQLPPYIAHLRANNCTSLQVTEFPLTASRTEEIYEEESFFSFINCEKLDEDSLWNIMDFAQFTIERAVYYNDGIMQFCYPGSRVPDWFRYKQTTEASITIELAPSFDDCKGFLFCSVLTKFASTEMIEINSECYFEDGEKFKNWRKCSYFKMELKSDHVFLWYERLFLEDVLRIVRERGDDDSTNTTYNPKLSFEFYVRTGNEGKRDGLIKACGVFPVYAS